MGASLSDLEQKCAFSCCGARQNTDHYINTEITRSSKRLRNLHINPKKTIPKTQNYTYTQLQSLTKYNESLDSDKDTDSESEENDYHTAMLDNEYTLSLISDDDSSNDETLDTSKILRNHRKTTTPIAPNSPKSPKSPRTPKQAKFSDESGNEFTDEYEERNRGISYMTDNSMMLMDINMDNNELDPIDFDTELPITSTQIYGNTSKAIDQLNGCDIIIKSPVNFNSGF